ncbi:hypothetical protein GALMADRAFT_236742 [Galerina marginata CBS 339.88]|uniref:Uncharacterized protein n=1 Tax=Galerina marginata (strain CBS 339.88) TaxID=685588 RepID=A0A067TYG5_GALM3|nr:hypothetical protein GALMADRAFT_236742 [Galerina marginata CBS 339.88]
MSDFRAPKRGGLRASRQGAAFDAPNWRLSGVDLTTFGRPNEGRLSCAKLTTLTRSGVPTRADFRASN